MTTMATTAIDADAPGAIETVLEARSRDLGDGFFVRRLLPAAKPRAVGPFVFFDHFGPTRFAPGTGLDVRPHPHINLATVTYLFEGAILHRDSLGTSQMIHPGDINWMTAGRGIVHSERTGPAERAAGSSLHGLQLWVALPRAHEEAEPAFHHHPAATLPELVDGGVRVRVLVGRAFGLRSPVETFSELTYLDVHLAAGARFVLPAVQPERGAYVVEGRVSDGARSFGPTHLLGFRSGGDAEIVAEEPTRLIVLGGEPLQEPRHIWWNFVSSSEARIEAAKRDWRARRGDPQGPFPLVPGDAEDFIPLPVG
jgi:redox-sensitive bicupin YhaK (pirin superfamily)